MRILIIEDENEIGLALKRGLEAENFDVDVAMIGNSGSFSANLSDYDLALLDLNLPGSDDLQALAALRRQNKEIPVLILTARHAVKDRVRGLENGGDDYLVKPFAFPELVARVKALFRRGKFQTAASLKYGALEMDLIARKVSRDGRPLDLTVREFELLEYFLRNRNQMVSRDMLARDVWKEPMRATSLDNVIDVHMARLRRKVDRDAGQKMIQTVRGMGFILREK